MKKSAFTIMELIFVIIVIGILSAVFIPRFGQNQLSEATNQLISHIRYTQHLALVDDKFDPNNANWYRTRWQIIFGSSAYTDNKIAYSIFSDAAAYSGQPDLSEIAKNPQNKSKLLSGGYSGILYTTDAQATEALNIGKKYGIADYKITGGGGTTTNTVRIAFDHLGRPYKRDISDASVTSPVIGLAVSNIYIKLCRATCTGADDTANNDNEAVIVIEPETGYVHLL